MSSYPQYSKDWHQCRECGCTRPDRELRRLALRDDVLKLDEEVHRCTDQVLCARLKVDVELERKRQAGLSPAVPIRDRKEPA